jgi:hypothetical protein
MAIRCWRKLNTDQRKRKLTSLLETLAVLAADAWSGGPGPDRDGNTCHPRVPASALSCRPAGAIPLGQDAAGELVCDFGCADDSPDVLGLVMPSVAHPERGGAPVS